MNNLEYLDSISAGATPSEPKSDLFSGLFPKIFFGLLGLVFLIIIVLFIYVATTPSESTIPTDLSRIYLRSESLSSSLSNYSSNIKSSSLRSTASSLSSTLSTLSSSASTVLTSSYGLKLPSPSSDLSPEDQALSSDLETSLETGRLNGILDRTLAREMAYHTSLLVILLDSVLQKLPDSSPEYSAFSSSRASLSQLQQTFSSFSDATH